MNYLTEFTYRIVFEGREHYRVMNQNNEILPAKIAGKLRQNEDLWPTVGDWVQGIPQPGDWVLITDVAPRSSLLQRKEPGSPKTQVLAANVDILFVVTSANQDLNLNRIERYVVLATSGNIRPVILVNKIELAEDPHQVLDRVASRFHDVDVLGVSAQEGWNLDALEDYAKPGVTVALIGSSGVGKSTLCNALLGTNEIVTKEIREEDSRGRHATTHRQLHVTLTGAILIDSPGIRQVGFTEDTDLGSGFSDLEGLALRCRFTDCQHESEPGCAIQAALLNGDLCPDRWQNYLKLAKEQAFVLRKASKALQAEEKSKWRKIHMANRSRMKLKGR
ncbi:MAG: ribosome small subunit-dependent GTPase A [Bdellovibrionales bacterium]